MSRRRRWLAFSLSMVLLSAAGTQRLSERGGEVRSAPIASGPAASQAALVCELERRNPRLSRHTSDRIARSLLRCEDEHALPRDLLLALIWVESSARPYAHSYKGALGLMQVMPHMYEQLELPGHAAHIETNIEAGCLLLAENIERLGEEDGISAYFWGSSILNDSYLEKVRGTRQDIADRLAHEPQCG